MGRIANTPNPPYYAVVFTSELTSGEHGYEKMADKMVELASNQPGFLGVESSDRDHEGLGITVSYWDSLESIANWKDHAIHKIAQEKGKAIWYTRFGLRVCKVERDSFFEM